jgi:hypothetical protein
MMSFSLVLLWCCLVDVGSVWGQALPNYTFYVDSEWTPMANTTSDGSIQFPFQNVSALANIMTKFAQQDIMIQTLIVYMAPRLYTGPANCFQVLYLLGTLEFELHGAWTNGTNRNSASLDEATFECVNDSPSDSSRLTWMGLFGVQNRFAMHDVMFRNSRGTCDTTWLTYDVVFDGNTTVLHCERYTGLPRVICGGVVLSTAQKPTKAVVEFRNVHFHNNTIRADSSFIFGRQKAVAEHSIHSPLMVLARGWALLCDDVLIANSTFVNNFLVVSPSPSKSGVVVSGSLRQYGAIGGGGLMVSGGGVKLSNCSFCGNMVVASNRSLDIPPSEQVFSIPFFTDVVAGGGAIIDVGFFLTIENSNFENNSALGVRSAGGAVALRWSSELTRALFGTISITDCSFTNNSVGMWVKDYYVVNRNVTNMNIMSEALGGALVSGLSWPNSTNQFLPTPMYVSDCHFEANSVNLQYSLWLPRSACAGAAVFVLKIVADRCAFVDNSAVCALPSGTVIEAQAFSLVNSSFVNNNAVSLLPTLGSSGAVISNRLLTRVDATMCDNALVQIISCSFVANDPNAMTSSPISGAIYMARDCTAAEVALSGTTFDGFVALWIVRVTAKSRLSVSFVRFVNCAGSSLFALEGAQFPLAFTGFAYNSSAVYGPLILLSANAVDTVFKAMNVSMRGGYPILRITDVAQVNLKPAFENCDCNSDFLCATTGVELELVTPIGMLPRGSSVTLRNGAFRNVQGVALIRITERGGVGLSDFDFFDLEFVDCKYSFALVFESPLQSERHITIQDSVVSNNVVLMTFFYGRGVSTSTDVATVVTVNNVSFVDNRSGGDGDADVTIVDVGGQDRYAGATGASSDSFVCKVVDSVVRNNVGIAVARGSKVIVHGTVFVNNTVSGALLGDLSGMTGGVFFDLEFRGNRGALLRYVPTSVRGFNDTDLYCEDITVVDHVSNGSVIELAYSDLPIKVRLFWLTFADIVAGDSVLALMRADDVAMANCSFSNVTVSHLTRTCGGSLFIGVTSDVVTMSNVSFVGSSAAFGGALCLGEPADLNVSSAVFANNSARVGADVFYSSASAARAVDGQLAAWAPQRASIASTADMGGYETGVMAGVPVDITFTALDAFGRVAPLGAQAPTQLARFAVDLTTTNCTHDRAGESFVCIINEYEHSCVGRIAFRGELDGGCVANFSLRSIDVELPRAVAVVGGVPTLHGARPVAIVPCAVGFGLTRSANNNSKQCEPCAAGTYNVDASVQQCFLCDESLFCSGRDLVAAQDGYWARRRGDGSIATFLCDADVCTSGVPGISLSQCTEGREGVLCASCVNATFTPVAPRGNVSCIECDGVNVPIVVGGIAAVAVLAFVLHVSVIGTSARVKILFFYTQTIALMLPKSIARTLFAAFDFRPVSGSAAFGGVCVAPLNGFELLALHLSYPLLLGSTLTLIFLVWHLVGALRGRCGGSGGVRGGAALSTATLPLPNAENADNDDTVVVVAAADVNGVSVNDDDATDDVPLMSSRSSLSAGGASGTLTSELPTAPLFAWVRWQRSIMSFAFLSFSVVLDCAIKLVRCDEIDRSLSVLAADARQFCIRNGLQDPLYSKWRAFALYGLVPYVSIVVVALPLITWRRRVRPHARLWRNKMRWGFLSDGYRVRFHYWECVILLRRVVFGVLCALLPLGSDIREQALLGSCLLALSAHVMARPFVHESDNVAETLSLLALTFNGVAFQRDLFDRSGAGFYLSAACIAAPAIVIGGSIFYEKVLAVVGIIRKRNARRAAKRAR